MPGRPRARRRPGRSCPSRGREHAVGFAQGDRFGGAQGRVVEAAEEGFLPLAARALSPDGFQQRPGLGRAGDRPAVDGLSDLGGFPLDPVEGTGGEQPQFHGVAERVGEHRPLAAGGGRGGGLAVQPPRARAQDGADGSWVFQRRDRQGCLRDPVQRPGDLLGGGPAGAGGVERIAEQGPADDGGVGGVAVPAGQGEGDRGERLGYRPAGFRGQVGPFHLGVRAGVLIPGSRSRGGALGPGGQAGRRVERLAVAGGVFEGAQERVRQGLGGKRLAVLAALDRPPDPVPAAGGVADLPDVPES